MPKPSQYRCRRCKFKHFPGCGFDKGVETYHTEHKAGCMIRFRKCPRCECKFRTIEQTQESAKYIEIGVPDDEIPDTKKPEPTPEFYQNRFIGMVPASEVVGVES